MNKMGTNFHGGEIGRLSEQFVQPTVGKKFAHHKYSYLYINSFNTGTTDDHKYINIRSKKISARYKRKINKLEQINKEEKLLLIYLD